MPVFPFGAGVLLLYQSFAELFQLLPGALDKKTGKQIMDLLHQVVLKNGIMLLIVTHDLDIAKTCNTIFEMDGGRLQCVKYDS